MEGDSETPRCGGCGRTFERRAALAAHTHTCQPRSRALQLAHAHTHTTRRPETKRIEIQIRKDYHKGPTGIHVNRTADANGETLVVPRWSKKAAIYVSLLTKCNFKSVFFGEIDPDYPSVTILQNSNSRLLRPPALLPG